MTGTARRNKVIEGANGQIMENPVHLFSIYYEWNGKPLDEGSEQMQFDLTFKMITLDTLLRIFLRGKISATAKRPFLGRPTVINHVAGKKDDSGSRKGIRAD